MIYTLSTHTSSKPDLRINTISKFFYHSFYLLTALFLLLPAGCHDFIVKSSDQRVYKLIENSQNETLGYNIDMNIGDESEQILKNKRMYEHHPRPLDPPLIPDEYQNQIEPSPGVSFVQVTDFTENNDSQNSIQNQVDPEQVNTPVDKKAIDPDETSYLPEDIIGSNAYGDFISDQTDYSATRLTPDVFPNVPEEDISYMSLGDSLQFASKYAVQLKNAKEDLYIAALDLSLERHLWTPQLVASVRADYNNTGEINGFDESFDIVSEISATQRLPYGGEVSARVISSLMRDLSEHVTNAETGQMILSANIPLLRGAGKVAQESRFQAERQLIYAVRTYERFRREFLVSIASDYFDLQQTKAQINNAYQASISRLEDKRKAEMIAPTSKNRDISDLPRAMSSFRSAEASLVSAKERHQTSLDQFKVRIGMDIRNILDVIPQGEDQDSEQLELLLSDVELDTATNTALKYRLDVLTSADQVDDSRRGIHIAENDVLPDLDISASATMNTDPERFNSADFETSRTTYAGTIELATNDRFAQRNAYRRSIITFRREKRRHVQFLDQVRADVRRALRRLNQQENLYEIQQLNVKENIFRRDAAEARFNLGRSTNQDKIDAEFDLLNAQNNLAAAIANYRIAILEFRRDTGTLQVTPDGNFSLTAFPNPEDINLEEFERQMN